jgi:hypothetical protein
VKAETLPRRAQCGVGARGDIGVHRHWGGEANRVVAPQGLTISKLGGLGDQVVGDRNDGQLVNEDAELGVGFDVGRLRSATENSS